MTEREEFIRLIAKASREEVLATAAIMFTLVEGAQERFKLDDYTRGECKRAIRLCRIAQASYRRKRYEDGVDRMEQAAAKIRNHLHRVRQN